MTSINHPDKITLDAYSDPQVPTATQGGSYSRFTNTLKTPILGAKGIQLINANMINSVLQLNDQSQLMFFYYSNASATNIAVYGNLRCVRLYPSNYVPFPGYTTYVKNKYWNNCTELAAALTAAASTGGDSSTFNPVWIPDVITFSYDTTTRKFSINSTNGTTFIAPAAADDPNVLDVLNGITDTSSPIKINPISIGANNYASALVQPFKSGQSMNARIGFAMSYNTRPLWAGGSTQVGVASSSGIPLATPIEADANPILLGAQNVNVYLSIATGSGLDSWSNRKNLVASIPLEVAPLNINSYTTSSVEKPAASIPNEIYEITVELFDDHGLPFVQPPNYNTELVFSIFY